MGFISEPYENEVGNFDPNISSEPQNLALIPNTDISISINNINDILIQNFTLIIVMGKIFSLMGIQYLLYKKRLNKVLYID